MSSPAKPHASIERLLAKMPEWGASDLFVCVGRPPAVRLHGAVVPLEIPPTRGEDVERFVADLLPAALAERFAHSGDLDVGYTLGLGQRFRINLARQQGLVSIVARALPSGALSLTELGLPAAVEALSDLPRGLVLVTGTTGAGKSTTLAAMVHRINRERSTHIITIEEPIEFVHADLKSRVTQREVGIDTASFEVALRQALRESPDVIMIGELRDMNTMQVAVQAALTGHLVFATLHTVDASQTLQRILSLMPEDQRDQLALDLSMCLRGVISQRLLPRRDGQGRAVAIELLSVSPAAARLIREQRVPDLQDLMKASTDPSIVTFDRSLLALYKRGVVGYEVCAAYASNPDEFALSAGGMHTGVNAFRSDGPDAPVTGLDMHELLRLMTERGASDLHLSVGRPPLLRVMGELRAEELPALSAGDLRVLLHSILSIRQRSTYELEREIDFSLALGSGRRFRVNAYYERGHIAAAFRAIATTIPTPEVLGLPNAVLEMGKQPHGLLLVVGPTGAGKTTTLACLVDRINETRHAHVITIEDPIEYVHVPKRATIHQREVNADTKSFATALRYILRQDPDVVLIGELRDLETVSSALTAAETGHLVLATLHTNDAVQTIDRIVDVFPPHQQGQARSQLAASLIGVVSQRLLTRADGKGRVAAYEVMVANAAIRTLVREQKMHQAFSTMQAATSQGMQTLDRDLERLVKQKLVTKEEAQRYLRNPTQLDKPQEPPPVAR